VALAGVKRAFEEAGVEPHEIIGCSGGAIWGSMWAAGMSSDEMTDFSLSWRPEEPEVTIGHLVRVAIALPLFIESVSVRGHLYVDGGIIENWPAQPAIEAGDRFDQVIGVNLMLPKGFEPRDISGWPDRTGGLLQASRQLQQGYHLELARRAKDELGEKLKLIEPIDEAEIRGVSFYDLFLDRTQWPRLIQQGYDSATQVLQGFR
jgi:predicted acylesterase/phospholipase RssA